MNKLLSRGAALLAALGFAGLAQAQAYPSKPIRLIVSAAPGGAGDIAARQFSTAFQTRLGQPIVVENRPGANGIIGTRYVAQATPDGYTLLSSGAYATHPLFNKANGIDITREMAAVTALQPLPLAFMTTPGMPLRTIAQVVSYARANPGKLNYASPGQPALELFMAMFAHHAGGIPYTTIPYKGSGDAVTAVLNGESHITVGSLTAWAGHVKSGKANAIFVGLPKRSPLMPDTPTADEVGLKGFETVSYGGLWAPLATPRDIIQKLASEAAQVARNPEYAQKSAAAFGAEPIGSTPEEALRLAQREIQIFIEAAKIANYQPQ